MDESLFAPKFLVYRRETKSLETVFRLILYERKINSPCKQYTSFLLVKLKCCCLPGIVRKQTKFVNVFDKNPAIFQTSSLVHNQNSRMLITFFRTEERGTGRVKCLAYEHNAMTQGRARTRTA